MVIVDTLATARMDVLCSSWHLDRAWSVLGLEDSCVFDAMAW